ncbi:hypothetical protein DFH08DRAFT_165545 [Mycena albidolilacea]|uniref:V-ATPase proteolipid subunit C-like domain-containing protein n=1 Tax=Mycena albidolilacea TaxID=1033008 RepID=A0AAD7AQR7_9AGAR|nr:hypothetical protein DFH08DRAFT_165545 [Mycena albidolilacea]
MSDLCPVYAPFFSAMGCTSAIAFTYIGASYGTAKSGVGVAAMSVLRPDQMMKCVVPLNTATHHSSFSTTIVYCPSVVYDRYHRSTAQSQHSS